jgi:sulfur-carrier protein adenylyltransferase/sulfurtransferase
MKRFHIQELETSMFDNLKKLFIPVQALDPDEARDFINKHKEGTYTLLDVRQPGEYEKDHIPGATLIPLPQLYDSLDKLDPDKPVIVY